MRTPLIPNPSKVTEQVPGTKTSVSVEDLGSSRVSFHTESWWDSVLDTVPVLRVDCHRTSKGTETWRPLRCKERTPGYPQRQKYLRIFLRPRGTLPFWSFHLSNEYLHYSTFPYFTNLHPWVCLDQSLGRGREFSRPWNPFTESKRSRECNKGPNLRPFLLPSTLTNIHDSPLVWGETWCLSVVIVVIQSGHPEDHNRKTRGI